MNRRNFLKSIGKICAVLPFVGSSSAVGGSGASEGQPEWIEESFRRQSICRPKPTGTRPATKAESCAILNNLGCKEFRDALTEVVEEKLATYYWIDMGYWSFGVKQLACCYTHSDGTRMRLAVLSEDDRIEETKKVTEKRKKAIEGGAWYPTSTTEYYLA